MKRNLRRTFGAAALAAVFLTGCSQSMSPGHGGMASPASTSATSAASLRTALNTLFAEHVYLAAAATGAALGGREAEFKAAAGALDASSDRGKQVNVVGELVAYTQDFGAVLSAANPNLPKSVVADLVKHHVATLKEVIDAQAAKDPARAWAVTRTRG